MALTYAQSAALMKDTAFVDRVKVAILKYATSILIEDASTHTHHNARNRWAVGAIGNPDGAAQNATPPIVLDPQVQADGDTISDTNLQTAVETTINNQII